MCAAREQGALQGGEDLSFEPLRTELSALLRQKLRGRLANAELHALSWESTFAKGRFLLSVFLDRFLCFGTTTGFRFISTRAF